MLSKKIKSIIKKVVISGLLFFCLLLPIKVSATKICLDLAHSDVYTESVRDNGAYSPCGKYNERELVSDITMKVKDRLDNLGYETVLTRDLEGSISIEDRVSLANSIENLDLFLSLHANSSEKPSTGTEGYVNNSWSFTNAICREISNTFDIPYRKTVASPYYNRLINPSSSLLEIAFMNSEQDLDILINHQDEVADIVVRNIQKYYPLEEKQETKTISTNLGSFDVKINYK
jgi:N-acetylmuramoyl-L-alanine amidase